MRVTRSLLSFWYHMEPSDRIILHFTGKEHICRNQIFDQTYPDITDAKVQWGGAYGDRSLFVDYSYEGSLARIDRLMSMNLTNHCEVRATSTSPNRKEEPEWLGKCTKKANGDLHMYLSGKWGSMETSRAVDSETWRIQWRFYGSPSTFLSFIQDKIFDKKPIEMILDSYLSLTSLTTVVLEQVHQMKNQIEELYYAPGMPGYEKAKKQFEKHQKASYYG